MKQKRGQFYLIAGIIIIGLIVGFATISNYSRKTNPKMLYDLKEEIEIESEKVLDYITYHQELTDDQKKNKLVDFTKLYKDNEEKQNLYFIFGDQNKITFIGYQELSIQEQVKVNNDDIVFNENGEASKDITNPGDIVTIKIISDSEYTYEFELKAGENFYFIISQEIGGGKYIIRN